MRSLALWMTIYLLSGTVAFASASLEAQVQRHEDRITQLENQLDDLKYLLETGQQTTTQQTRPMADSLIGRWDCTDGAFRSEVQFKPNGRILRTDLTLGSTKSAQWVRRSKDEIALLNGNTFKFESYSQDQITFIETNTRSKWQCLRIED